VLHTVLQLRVNSEERLGPITYGPDP
jgi:hypothetical protein